MNHQNHQGFCPNHPAEEEVVAVYSAVASDRKYCADCFAGLFGPLSENQRLSMAIARSIWTAPKATDGGV